MKFAIYIIRKQSISVNLKEVIIINYKNNYLFEKADILYFWDCPANIIKKRLFETKFRALIKGCNVCYMA